MQLDHVVLMVENLAQGTEQYAAQGFTVTPGGEHTHGNTHNALIALQDGVYLELLAFKVPHATPHRWDRYRAFPGVIDYCLGFASVAGAVRDINARGLDYPAPIETGRLRPDGVELRWRSSQLADQERGLPFLIEDVTPRSLRVPGGGRPQVAGAPVYGAGADVPGGAAANHANGASGVAQLEVLVPDLARARSDFSALLGSEGRGEEAALIFDLEGVPLRLTAPEAGSAECKLLAARGAGAWRLTLHGNCGSHIVL